MAILQECPVCHRRQSNKNQRCGCGEDLAKAKGSRRVRYWIVTSLPGGKQRWEVVKDAEGNPAGIKEAKAAEGKRQAQRVENPSILERSPADKWTFTKLAEWYLALGPVKKLTSFTRIQQGIANFNREFGDRIVSSLKPLDLEEYQEKRLEAGKAPATVDMELSLVKTMIKRAHDNGKCDDRTCRAFRPITKKLKKGANSRKAHTLDVEQYLKLLEVAPDHLKAFLVIAYNCGMRTGELRLLQWPYVDREKRVIRLPAEITKENKAKTIPINHHVETVLAGLPRALHHGFVLTYQGEPIKSPGGLKNSFRTACEQAGIVYGQHEPGGIVFHDLRGSAKSNMFRAGVGKEYRDAILGHSSKDMDAHYLDVSEDDLHRAMAIYTAWLDEKMAILSENLSKVNDRSKPNL